MPVYGTALKSVLEFHRSRWKKPMDKKNIYEINKKAKAIDVSESFTGQVILVFNINQGGVTNIERSVKETLK